MDSGSFWKLLCIISFCALAFSSSYVAAESVPTESECRPHIEKALNIIKADVKEPDSAEISVDIDDDSKEDENILDVNDDIEDHTENSDEEATVNLSNEDNNNEDSKEVTNEIDSNETNDIEPNENDQSTEDQDQDPEEAKESENQSDSNEDSNNSKEGSESDTKDDEQSTEVDGTDNDSGEATDNEKSAEDNTDNSEEQSQQHQSQVEIESVDVNKDADSNEVETTEKPEESQEENDNEESASKEDAPTANEEDSTPDTDTDSNENEGNDENDENDENNSEEETQEKTTDSDEVEQSHEISAKSYPVDDLLLSEIPENLRDRSHIDEILRLNEDSMAQNEALGKIADNTLKELKRIYENAIKPLETWYKYRDLSNRHFGDPEIFSKPLVLLMGPWSGGKSSIINYLTDNEYADNSLKTGAEPSHPYFNILMHGETEQVLDGTQLSADWTFSGLQKFGQGLQDRLRGLKLPSKLLEKVDIVEIPGILEVRKHVSRIFPFNDACQWFIDRADIIFLVYDPSKLDVGPETEAILDQLKGREYQTRIILNKADQVHPEELLRVQGALIWNISPLMSSQQPPIMYTVSLWSNPFEENTPIRLLQAQEKALLQDLAQAIEHRIENKIASARRFAVRVRNHAKMVDCYLTTYYNHKTLFGNKKTISSEIVAHPQNYHIYEGLSTLTNISRYDLPDPDLYRDFFQLNPLYEFKKLSETCTYFRGCPINKLDVAIAYDLPELVNRYKRSVGLTLNTLELGNGSNDSSTDRR